MSRLESFIRRLAAQRDILDMICREIPLLDGPVIELGLGNGRTYDHLRERLPGRRIIAFDRACGAHRASMPPEGDLVLGEIRETAAAFVGIGAALVHADIGSGYDDLDAENLKWLPELTVGLLATFRDRCKRRGPRPPAAQETSDPGLRPRGPLPSLPTRLTASRCAAKARGRRCKQEQRARARLATSFSRNKKARCGRRCSGLYSMRRGRRCVAGICRHLVWEE